MSVRQAGTAVSLSFHLFLFSLSGNLQWIDLSGTERYRDEEREKEEKQFRRLPISQLSLSLSLSVYSVECGNWDTHNIVKVRRGITGVRTTR